MVRATANRGRSLTGITLLHALLGALLGALSLAGCAGSRLPYPGPGGGADWIMFGGGPGRVNASPARPAPPFRMAWEADAGSGFGPYSPALSESTVFVATLAGEVRALNLSDGRETGSRNFGNSAFGTPLVLSGRLVVALSGEGNNLVCYDLRSGTEQWSVPAADVESSLLAADGGIVASGTDGSVTMYDTLRGGEVWKYAPAGRSSSRSSPASDGSRVVVGYDGGEVVALELATGKLLWEAAPGGAVFSTPALAGGMAFVTSRDGKVYALDAGSGELAWSRDLGSPLYGSPAVGGLPSVAEGRLFVGTTGGEVVALGTAGGEVLWRTRLSGPVGSAPLVCGEYLYVGDLTKNFYAVSTGTGEIAWRSQVPGRIRCTPMAVPGGIIVLSETRNVLFFAEER